MVTVDNHPTDRSINVKKLGKDCITPKTTNFRHKLFRHLDQDPMKASQLRILPTPPSLLQPPFTEPRSHTPFSFLTPQHPTSSNGLFRIVGTQWLSRQGKHWNLDFSKSASQRTI